MQSINFEILRDKWSNLADLGGYAENYIFSDPHSSVLKLRIFIESLTIYLFKDLNIHYDFNISLFNNLKNEKFESLITPSILKRFHAIRKKGNDGGHIGGTITNDDALWLVKEAHVIACWLNATYNNQSAPCNEFIIPTNNGEKINHLKETIKELEETLSKEREYYSSSPKENPEDDKVLTFKQNNQNVADSMNIDDIEIDQRMNLEEFFADNSLTDGQSKLIKKLQSFLTTNDQNIFLLKGYAGTGKTFITKGLTEYLTSIGRKYILAAPTGKAAKVIREKTNSEAYTIHKTIYSDKDLKEYQDNDDRAYKFYFDLRVNDNPDNTVYIIDEASMLSDVYNEMENIIFGSGYLLTDLLKFINLDHNDHNKKVIFIGDNAQLPPINMNMSPALNKEYLVKKFGLISTEYELIDVVRQEDNSGILQNSINLRESINNRICQSINIDLNYNDINSIEEEQFIEKYMQIINYKLDKKTMIIAYTNYLVKEYNQAIRKKLFDNIDVLNERDRIILLTNSSRYQIRLSNGDFGLIYKVSNNTEHRPVTIKRKNHETNKVQDINIDLYFRDVEIIFKDEKNKPYLIPCKIIENLLFSEKASLSSDENKAIYLDFIIRNKNLQPNTLEWKEALRSDPYFNALKIKFGYAITCHKAQGSEWENVFVNCKHSNTQCEDYLRWLYTAITRSSKSLYLTSLPKPTISASQYIKEKITKLCNEEYLNIINIQNHNFHDIYTFQRDELTDKIKIHYNGNFKITSISSIENNNFSLVEKLRKLFFQDFPEKFLEDFYFQLKGKLEKRNIQIFNIVHNQNSEKYIFLKDNIQATIDFWYKNNGEFTERRWNPNSSDELVNEIKGLI